MISAYLNRVLVKVVELEAKQGLILVPKDKKEYQIGEVVSSCLENVSKGQYVYTRKFAGLIVEYDGVQYVSLDEKEILAISNELK
jgi:co-chaperonin GroES (HSP10)